jgi:hypothetical protein
VRIGAGQQQRGPLGQPPARRQFTVSAEISQEDHVRVEVRDAGGRWNRRADGEGRPHGLDIARALAADFGIAGDALTGWIVWARFDWPERSTS